MDEEDINEKEELKNKIEEAFAIEDSIKLRIGMLFHEAEKEELWEEEGSLKEFLGSLNRKRANTSTVNRRMNLYRAFCIVGGYSIKDIETIDESRLSWIRKRFYNSENESFIIQAREIKEWIAKAETLSTTDWGIEKKQLDRPVPEGHKHNWGGKEYWDCECGERTWADPNQLS